MAVVIITELPPMADRAMEEAVATELDVDHNPPAGLIIHTASETDGVITIVDVWESRKLFEDFEAQRLGPAVGKVTGMGPGQAPPMDRKFLEPYRVQPNN